MQDLYDSYLISAFFLFLILISIKSFVTTSGMCI